MAASLPHIIVAHGSWHTPEAYASFQDALEQRGYEVTIPSLPTSRADGITKTLSNDCQFFRAKLERLVKRGCEVVVVMHSYGGMVGAGSVHGLEKKIGDKGGVVGLVYLTCFIPGPTGSLADGVGGSLPPWINFEVDEKSGIRMCFVAEKLAPSLFYEPYHAAEAFARRLNPQSASTQFDPLVNGPGYMNWKVPMVYTICNKDQALLPQFQEIMIHNAEKNLNIEIERVYIDGSHFPFMQLPESCVDAVDHVVRQGKSN